MAWIEADTGTAGDQAFSFIGIATFSDAAGQLRYQNIGEETRLLGDTDGDALTDIAA